MNLEVKSCCGSETLQIDFANPTDFCTGRVVVSLLNDGDSQQRRSKRRGLLPPADFSFIRQHTGPVERTPLGRPAESKAGAVGFIKIRNDL